MVNDSLTLWNNLKNIFDHHKDISLPKPKHKWLNLGLQDYARVSNYNSTMFPITSKLILCGEKLLIEIYLKKHSLLFKQQHYRECPYTKCYELITTFLTVEQNNKLIMKNHELRPYGFQPFIEVNANTSTTSGRN